MQAAQRLLAGRGERRDGRGETELQVLALAGDPLAVEIRQERILFGDQPADALAESFALEVGDVPGVLHQRERPAAHAHQRFRHLGGDPRQQRGRTRQHLEDVHTATVTPGGLFRSTAEHAEHAAARKWSEAYLSFLGWSRTTPTIGATAAHLAAMMIRTVRDSTRWAPSPQCPKTASSRPIAQDTSGSAPAPASSASGSRIQGDPRSLRNRAHSEATGLSRSCFATAQRSNSARASFARCCRASTLPKRRSASKTSGHSSAYRAKALLASSSLPCSE